MAFDPERFLTAQQHLWSGHAAALHELTAGRKEGHWIWYVFPQIAGLGYSHQSMTYALGGAEDARAYFAHPVLRQRLCDVTAAVHGHAAAGASLAYLMGGRIDAQKLVSSLRLFDQALATADPDPESDQFSAHAGAILDVAERQGLPRCTHTLRAVAARP